MVFFVCGSCGAAIKKNQVEKHFFRCRNAGLTCMDCSKEFVGNSYVSHTRCLTENQKYGGSGYVESETSAQKKRQQWISRLREKVESSRDMPYSVKLLFRRFLEHDNIPTNKKKFFNFLKSNNVRDERLGEMAWKLVEEVKNESVGKNGSNEPEQNDTNSQETKEVDDSTMKEDSKTTEVEPQAELKHKSKRERKLERQKKKNSNNELEENDTNSQETKEEDSTSAKEELQAEPKRKSKRERKLERQKEQTKVQKKDKRKRTAEDEEGEAGKAEVTEKPKKKKKKDKADQENVEPQNGHEESMDLGNEDSDCANGSRGGPFKWKKAICTVLQDAPEEGMKMKKFKRKIMALYLESKSDEAQRKSVVEIDALISKKLERRNDKYTVTKDRVKLKVAS